MDKQPHVGKLEFDDTQLDPEFVKHCAMQAEKQLWDYANDPKANPMMAQMLGMFLNRHMMMLGIMKGVVDIHNAAYSAAHDAVDPAKGVDVSQQLANLALLAATSATAFGEQMGHIVVRFKHAENCVEFDNMSGKGCTGDAAPAPDEPQGVH